MFFSDWHYTGAELWRRMSVPYVGHFVITEEENYPKSLGIIIIF